MHVVFRLELDLSVFRKRAATAKPQRSADASYMEMEKLGGAMPSYMAVGAVKPGDPGYMAVTARFVVPQAPSSLSFRLALTITVERRPKRLPNMV